MANPAARICARTILLASAALAGTATANAQSLSQTIDKEEQMIVTGTRDPHQTARQSLSPVQVVTASQLRATGMTDLRDALTQLVPSVSRQVMGLDQASLTDSLSLRGLSADQTLILVNGKRRHTTAALSLNGGPQQGTTPVDLDMIPVSSVDHIEVLEDGASAQYGSDAIAGVINIILKNKPHGVTLQSLNGVYGAGDGVTTGESVNGGIDLGRGFLNLSAEVKHQDRTVRVGADTRTGRPDNTAIGSPESTRVGIEANFAYHITNNIEAYSFDTYTYRYGKRWAYLRTGSSLPAIYLGGYTPVETLADNDFGVTTGFRGKHLLGWEWDLATTYGGDHDGLGLNDSANLGLYSATGATPLSFDVGSFHNSQWTSDLDFRRSIVVPLMAGPINLAFGGAYRYESYGIDSGTSPSYIDGGAQGYQGYSPVNRVRANRDVTSGYIDVSTLPLPRWHVDLAGRFEHYTDVGNTENGKVSTRYDIARWIALRGTVSNGFRAPTLAQENYASIITSPTYAVAQLPVNSAGARLLGASPLKPERSTNFSAGVVLDPLPSLHLTLDAYQISVRDRIVDGGVYNGAAALEAIALQGASVRGIADADAVTAQYFTNGASTRTRGLDATAAYNTSFGSYGRVRWDAEVNFNQTAIRSIADDANGRPLLNAQQAAFLTSAYPRNKIIIGGVWTRGRWDTSLHEIRYGHTSSDLTYYEGPYAFSVADFYHQVNRPRYVTNLELGYHVTRQIHLVAGANNLANTYPSRIPGVASYLHVAKYDTYSQQLGQDGGFYYVRADASF